MAIRPSPALSSAQAWPVVILPRPTAPPMAWFSRPAPTHFPEVEGTRPDGTRVRLPDDLPADATVIVVSFRDDLDAVADQWVRLADRVTAGYEGRVAVWETPILGRAARALDALGSVIRDDDEAPDAHRTVRLHTDAGDLRKALGLRRADTVVAYLVARDGRIVWTGEDAVDLTEIAALEAALAELLG